MKSKIIIVNEQDNIIGYKKQSGLKSGDIYRVSALWITNSKGDILLAKRSLSKSHDPGKWGPAVAGTIDKGEMYDSNIIKEANEELGLRDIQLKKGPKERVFGKHNYFVQWYTITLDKDIGDFTVQEDEVEEIKWFTKEELLKELKVNPEKFLRTMKQWVDLFC